MTRPANTRRTEAQEREAAELRVGWRMAGIGMTVASEVVAGALLGWLIDRWRGHGNLGVLIGSIAGIAVGLFSLIRQSLKLNRELELQAPTAGRGKALPADEPLRDWEARDAEHDADDWNAKAD